MFNKSTFLIFFIIQISVSQIDTTLKEYFPMEIGNMWEYEEDMFPDYWHYQIKVTRDTIMPNGKIYFEYRNSGDPLFTKYYRMDDSLNVYQYKKNNCSQQEIIVFKLGVKDKTVWDVSKIGGINCGDTVNGFIGLYRSLNQFYPKLFLYKDTRLYSEAVINGVDTTFSPLVPKIDFIPTRLAKGLGIIWSQFEGPAQDLVGAVINGKKIGNISSVQQIDANQYPQILEIKNYPNPFNSSTTITYSISEKSDVKINIYNDLGVELAKVIDGMQNRGVYTLRYTPNNLPSGIYFVRIATKNKYSVRKIIYSK